MHFFMSQSEIKCHNHFITNQNYEIQAFADAHGLEKLGIAAENMILEKFMDLVEYEEFLTMPKEMLIEVIKQDSLEVHDELIVFRHGF